MAAVDILATHGGNRARTVSEDRSSTRVLLACGVLSSIIYIAANLIGALMWDDYSLTSRTVSELSALGAPSRPVVATLLFSYGVLLVAFGMGINRVSHGNRALRRSAIAVMSFGVICALGPLAPMHQREVLAADGATLTDTLHIATTIVDVIFIILIISLGARVFGRRFRTYSWFTIIALVCFGSLAGLYGPGIQRNLATPWAGLTERISIGVFLLWIAVFGYMLKGHERKQ